MKYLLDTNVCIRYINGRSQSIRQKMRSLPPSDIVVCSIVKFEMFYGAMRSRRHNRVSSSNNNSLARSYRSRLMMCPQEFAAKFAPTRLQKAF